MRMARPVSPAVLLAALMWFAAPDLPAQPGPAGAAAPVPAAPPDTAVVRVSVPDSLPQPLAVHVVQDTLQFGGLLHLVLDYPAETAPDRLPAPLVGVDWLEPEVVAPPGLRERLRGRARPPVDLSGLPAAAGPRIVSSYHVYRRDPLQVQWHNQLSRVLIVVGQTTGSEETAAIRGPRDLAWRPWQLILLGVLGLGLLWLLRWWRHRRLRPVALSHWELPEPAWMEAAIGLAALLAQDTLARGDTRLFLDRLAALARGYVAGRYRIMAREMTGREIMRACSAQAFELSHPTGFARLIDLADRERYNPETPTPDFCRELSVQFFGRLNRTRLDTPWVATPAARLLEGQKAWAALTAELGTGAGRAVVLAGNEGEGR